MKQQKDQNKPSADILQKKLIQTKYSVVESMLTVRDSLQKQQLKVKSQKEKVQELHKKLIQLQYAENYNNRVAQRYQQRLEKLENTQNMAVALLSVKITYQKQRENFLTSRQEVCSQLRNSLSETKRKSLQIFQRRKNDRVRRIKKQQYQKYLEKKKACQSDIEYRRQKSCQIRESQMLGRQRLKRYEQFRLAQARFNYDQKRQQLFRSHAQKLNELRNLQSKISDAEEIFRKTQVLNDEVNHIESLYITGQ